jgi:hypothetical protein
MPVTHRLDAAIVHYEWNNAIPPRLLAEPGDTLVLDTRDAADGYYTAASTSRDTAARSAFKGHPDQRDRRRAELDRLRVAAGSDLRLRPAPPSLGTWGRAAGRPRPWPRRCLAGPVGPLLPGRVGRLAGGPGGDRDRPPAISGAHPCRRVFDLAGVEPARGGARPSQRSSGGPRPRATRHRPFALEGLTGTGRSRLRLFDTDARFVRGCGDGQVHGGAPRRRHAACMG